MSHSNVLPIDFGSIPPELQERDQWVLWKTIERDGKTTKIPLSVFGKAASSTDAKTWTSFDNAVSTFDAANQSGIGFVFTATDGFCGIDLDGCRDPETGCVADWAVDEVLRFASYTEISPSLTGLKIWITSDTQLQTGRKKELQVPEIVPKTPAVEVYTQGRYFAVTGLVYKNYRHIERRDSELQEFLKQYWPAAPAVDAPRHDWRSDDAVVERARKYVAKIPGAISGSSGHNATFHVACVLVKDFALTQDQAFDVISEWNATCDPPWSEHELRHKIESAARAPGTSGGLRNAKPERWDSIPVPERSVPNEISDKKLSDKKPTQKIESVSGAETVRSYDWTDLNDIGNAAHYATAYADELRYCAAWGKWLAWDDTRWKIDCDGRPLKLAKELVGRMFSDCLGEGKTGQPFMKEQVKHACESAKASRLRAMVDLAAPELPIRIEELDQDGWILNCMNGVVDLRTGEILPHDRTQGITKLCPTAFEMNAESPVWQAFLADVFGDAEMIDFVQRLFGHFLTADVSEQKLAIFHGSGANGKSTLLNAFMETVGPDYSMQCMPDFLMEKRGESHPTERASLFGKRFVSCVETEASRKLAESTVKMLTGGERIMARRMREDFWEFSPTHKLVLCTNHKPIISGTDHGIWRRLLLVPFLQRFDGARQDKQLPEKLRAEHAGILSWAVRGCLEWQRIGLNPPDSVCSATEDYRNAEDIFGRFIADCCVVEKSAAVRFSHLYEKFEAWANDAGEFIHSKRAVGGWLTESGFEKYSANGRHYRGLMLRQTSQVEDGEYAFK